MASAGHGYRETLTLVPKIKQIVRSYGQPSVFSEFPWHMWMHIFLPQDRKAIKKKQQNLLSSDGGSFRSNVWVLHVQPRKECALLTSVIPIANQILWHCSNSQSALRSKSGRCSTSLWDFVSGPISARPRKRECMRIAKIEPDLRLHSQSKLQQEPLTMKDQILATSGIQFM